MLRTNPHVRGHKTVNGAAYRPGSYHNAQAVVSGTSGDARGCQAVIGHYNRVSNVIPYSAKGHAAEDAVATQKELADKLVGTVIPQALQVVEDPLIRERLQVITDTDPQILADSVGRVAAACKYAGVNVRIQY